LRCPGSAVCITNTFGKKPPNSLLFFFRLYHSSKCKGYLYLLPGISANFGKKITFSPGKKFGFGISKKKTFEFLVIFPEILLPFY
jgi:hypothetical protein